MIVILICFLGGIGLGYLGRNRNRLPGIVSRLADIMLCILLLFLGFSIGVNDSIMSKLYELGLDALILAAGAILGSIVLTYPINYLLQRKNN